jgi:hypothetical protein
VAFTLTENNTIPVDELRVELADFIILSLYSIPKFKGLATSWNAMVKALEVVESKRSVDPTLTVKTDQQRIEEKILSVQVRVLVRFLVCSAEVQAAQSNSDWPSLDPAWVAAKLGRHVVATDDVAAQPKKKKMRLEEPQEAMTVALLQSLPQLLVSYKGDAYILSRLTSLPIWFRKWHSGFCLCL